jgi:hypothetical protein
VLLALGSLPALARAASFSASETAAACSVPEAHPGDGEDDRVAIQDALTSQGCAYLPAGRYDIEMAPATASGRRPTMMLDAPGAQIFGDGPGTVLAFKGSAGFEDWEGIRLKGAGPALHDLTINTAAVTETAEQTHAVKVLGPASDVEISRVSFNHPIRVGKSGDCVQLVGFNTVDDKRPIARVKIRENDFLHCDRSGVGVHSGTTQLEIADNRFKDVGNTDLDFEGTGGTSDVLIQHNTFTMSPGPHGAGAIQLQLVERARLTENVFNGRGIDDFESDDVEIDHNQITLTQATTTPVIFVHKESSRTHILDNTITREPSAGDGDVIAASPHNSGTPDHLEIDGNALVQRTSSAVVNSSGLVGLYVRHNSISYSGAREDVMAGVLALGSAGTFGIRTTDVRVEDNIFNGALHAAVATSGSNFGAGTLDTSGNVAPVATFGIFCDNWDSGGRVLGPITSTGDDWRAPNCGPQGFVQVFDDPPEPPGGDPPPGPEGGDGGDAPPPGPVSTPGPDTTAPLLSGVSLSPRQFRLAKEATPTAAGTRPGTVLRFSSSEAGTLSIRIERARPGQKVEQGGKLVCEAVLRPVKRGRCTVYSRTATLTRAIQAGFGSVALGGRIGGRWMKPDRYRLTVTARDAAGNRSAAISRTFTILAD